jgi:hypothetical protein
MRKADMTSKPPAKPPTPANRPRPLSAMVPGLTRDVFGTRNQLFGKMLAAWQQIAGADVAAQSLPIDLKFQRRPKTAADKPAGPGQAVLHLAVAPAYALELSYQKGLLIERLNMFFGYAAIKDIKIVQHSEVMNNKPAPLPPARPLTATESQKLAGMVAGIQEKDLQTALENLGKAIISRQKGAS